MTKVIARHDDETWAVKKIQALVAVEAELLKRRIGAIQEKLADFEHRYGELDREAMYGRVDDMELVEWEGEIETVSLLQKKLASLQRIAFEYE